MKTVYSTAWRLLLPFILIQTQAMTICTNQVKPTNARSVMTLDEAIERVSRMIGMAIAWTAIEAFLPVTDDAAFRRSALASSFVAALELARRGRLDIRQDEPFAPLEIRSA